MIFFLYSENKNISILTEVTVIYYRCNTYGTRNLQRFIWSMVSKRILREEIKVIANENLKKVSTRTREGLCCTKAGKQKLLEEELKLLIFHTIWRWWCILDSGYKLSYKKIFTLFLSVWGIVAHLYLIAQKLKRSQEF